MLALGCVLPAFAQSPALVGGGWGVPRFALVVYDSGSSYSTQDGFWESPLWSPTGERREMRTHAGMAIVEGARGSQTTSARGPVSMPWTTTSLANGTYTLTATVRDATGKIGSTMLGVAVRN